MSAQNSCDIIILGGGAAGLMCAIEAGKRGRSVKVLERNAAIGEKIRISGGGRCNFTNVSTSHDHFLSGNPHFCKSALARFTPEDFLALVRKHGIQYHEKKLGQLFCDGSSLEIIGMLEKECRDANVDIVVGCRISDVSKNEGFSVVTGSGELQSRSLVVATGGLSIPRLGATDFGIRIAGKFGVAVTPVKPGLVPLVAASGDVLFFSGLSGVSLDAVVTCGGTSFRENILFTHRGLSGPAILQVSSYWNPGDAVTINVSPDVDLHDLLNQRRGAPVDLVTALSGVLPRRFVKDWCERYVSPRPGNQYSLKELGSIAARLHGWNVIPSGTEGYAKAEVTCGGVDTRELSSKTMETIKVPGLYFIGESVNVTGHLGGYNFQWAWASGYAAGESA